MGNKLILMNDIWSLHQEVHYLLISFVPSISDAQKNIVNKFRKRNNWADRTCNY